jgi:hypothetical protein
MALSTTTNPAQQSNTQNPQTAGQSNLPGSQTGGVQPGTSQNLLESQGTIPLGNQQLTTVNLNPVTAASVQPQPQPKAPVEHHLNHGLILLTIVLLLVAAASTALINRSAKNTTY